jgi:hypothetical protein
MSEHRSEAEERSSNKQRGRCHAAAAEGGSL